MKKITELSPDGTSETPSNGPLTARPKSRGVVPETLIDSEGPAATLDYGEMNLQDAIESGYTDEAGQAVDKAKKDKKGSPTGAWTDIGAGRSSVVKRH